MKQWIIADHETDSYPLGAMLYYDPGDEYNRELAEEDEWPSVDGSVFEGSDYDRETLEDAIADGNSDQTFPNGPVDPSKTFWVASIGGG